MTAPPQAPTQPVRSLRRHLAKLFAGTMLLTFGLVGAGLLLWRLPQIEREAAEVTRHDLRNLANRLELILAARNARLETLTRLVRDLAPQEAADVLQQAVDSGGLFDAVHLVSAQGQVLGAGKRADAQGAEHDVRGMDLSGQELFQQARTQADIVWGSRYFSPLAGAPRVGAALRMADGRVLLAEMSGAVLAAGLRGASSLRSLAWVVDRQGEIVADLSRARYGRVNLYGGALLQAADAGRTELLPLALEGNAYDALAWRTPQLGWYLVVGEPAGWHSPQVRTSVMLVVLAVLGCALIGLLMTPFWSWWLARPLRRIARRSAHTTAGTSDGRPWPRSPVAEYNRLAGQVQNLAAVLHARQQRFLAIFNAAPVPMAVVEDGERPSVVEVNAAWCQEMRRRREDVLGRAAAELQLWSADDRARLMAGARDDRIEGEAQMWRGDGTPMQVQVFGRRIRLAARALLVWATVDIGPVRRVEQELHELNRDLERRVDKRTQALANSNQELSRALEQLTQAQHGLVQAEKMAALGALVAGVAHELNTPLGNGLMAVSTLADATEGFAGRLQGGLRRAALDDWLQALDQGCDIAGRNLHRAAELVQNFKQVAVDQASAQRRRFELAEVVQEMVVSMRPSFARTPYRVEVDVPARGLQLDSYPGALGQTLGNLIDNALKHGLEGRDHGTVRISAQADGADAVLLRVADDGRGIAPELQQDVFEAFVTTRMSRGGTGLGLHISRSAVTDILGGTMTLHSVPGAGSCFELRLPRHAPRPGAADGTGAVEGQP